LVRKPEENENKHGRRGEFSPICFSTASLCILEIEFVRIHITGNAGSGKSTLAKEIGSELNLPVFGLDKVVWQEGWAIRPSGERKQLEHDLCQKPLWVIEGVSSLARESADVVVFLDFNRAKCYWRCARRNWRYLFSSRPGLPERCPEIRILPKLVKLIWKFSSVMRPKILSERKGKEQAFFWLTNEAEIKVFTAEVKHNKSINYAPTAPDS